MTVQTVDLGLGTVTTLLAMPDCPHMLTGRDLVQKLRAAVSFAELELSKSNCGLR